ncbi:MAG: initiation factor 2B, partial [Pseudomonadota bacterium]|nr:initiation factor 2B [Pseudomonadota bacterium]
MQQLDAQAQSIVAELRQDRQSGATELARKTLDQVLAYLDRGQPDAGTLRALLSELRQARPSMIVIGNALARIDERGSAEPGEVREAVLDIRSQLANAASAMVRRARRDLPEAPVIMTHSASSAVLALFRSLAWDKQAFSVICTQSSPGLEGHTLATALNEL